MRITPTLVSSPTCLLTLPPPFFFLVAFSISISVASILAKKNNYEVDANQEFRALGLTNSIASFFSCHVSSSSLSRSLLQETSGKTQLAAIFSSSVILGIK